MAIRLCSAVGLAILLVTSARGAPPPAPAQLRTQLQHYLAAPLPTVESLVGLRIPPPSPMLVVASFGDRSTPADVDRGYAVGRTLNELLFGAHGSLDVEPPGAYSLDAAEPGVPAGRSRDSRANAYRVAAREAAQWCAHGTVEGGAPAVRVVAIVDRCRDGTEAARRTFAINADDDWPNALRAICEFVVASTTKPSLRSDAACGRAAAIRVSSFLAYAGYAASRGMPRERAEAIVAADPTFAPAVIELIGRLPSSDDKAAFMKQMDALAAAAGATPAVAMASYSRQLARNAWKIEHRPYDRLMTLIRANSQLRGLWMLLASSLSDAVTWDYPGGSKVVESVKQALHAEGAGYYPNQATHSAALAVTLDYYANWPDSYRARWQVGYAVMQYALMLRGNELWDKVPQHGKKAFRPLMKIADGFTESALATQAGAPNLWANRIATTYHAGGDWRMVFTTAADRHPQAPRIYQTAMNFAQAKWGGTPDARQYVQDLAVRNNPYAEWAKTLIERYETPAGP